MQVNAPRAKTQMNTEIPDESQRAQAAQDAQVAIEESMERARELLCEAKLAMRQQQALNFAAPSEPGRDASPQPVNVPPSQS
jgi:hypothetical protein